MAIRSHAQVDCENNDGNSAEQQVGVSWIGFPFDDDQGEAQDDAQHPCDAATDGKADRHPGHGDGRNEQQVPKVPDDATEKRPTDAGKIAVCQISQKGSSGLAKGPQRQCGQ